MLSQYEENLKNERLEKGQLSEDYENRIQMLNSVRAIIQVFFSAYHRYYCKRFESRSHLISGLSMTVWVRLFLNRTVVDSDCQWLWRWLPHRLSKRHFQWHALPTNRCRYHDLRVIIPKYLYVINDPPCNSVYAAKRLNKRSLFIYLFMIWNFFLQQVQDLKKALDSQKVSYNEHKYDDDDDTSRGGMMMVMMLTQWWWW